MTYVLRENYTPLLHFNFDIVMEVVPYLWLKSCCSYLLPYFLYHSHKERLKVITISYNACSQFGNMPTHLYPDNTKQVLMPILFIRVFSLVFTK
jgi:hypothetical protein